jgi:hypothetical protein
VSSIVNDGDIHGHTDTGRMSLGGSYNRFRPFQRKFGIAERNMGHGFTPRRFGIAAFCFVSKREQIISVAALQDSQ